MRFSTLVQSGPGAEPASCTMSTGSFLWVKSDWGVRLTPHPLLVPWSRRGRAIPLLPLWVVQPVQSLSACTRVHFTLPFRHLPWAKKKYSPETSEHSDAELTARISYSGKQVSVRYESHAQTSVRTTAIFITSKSNSQFHHGSIEFIVNMKFVMLVLTVTKIMLRR